MTDQRYASKTTWIIDLLREKQTTGKLTDTEMAATLGISASMWSHMKNGRREMGAAPLRGLALNYPDIWEKMGKHYNWPSA